jgi:hypothetical protein
MWFIAAVYKYSFLVQRSKFQVNPAMGGGGLGVPMAGLPETSAAQELRFVLRPLIVTNAGSHLQQVYGRGRIEIS